MSKKETLDRLLQGPAASQSVSSSMSNADSDEFQNCFSTRMEQPVSVRPIEELFIKYESEAKNWNELKIGRHEIEKLGHHEGPNETNNAADNVRLWPKRNLNIFIEGNIGAGKSTMLEYFSKLDFVETVPEPVEKWQNLHGHDILKMTYEEPRKHGFKFQSYVLLTSIENYIKPHRKPLRVMERSIFSQKCFIRINNEIDFIDDSSAVILNEWSNFAIRNFKIKADAIIYIRTTPEKLLKRVHSRGRQGEENINLEYLQRIHNAHEDWLLSREKDTKIIIVNGDLSPQNIIHEYEKCYNLLRAEGI